MALQALLQETPDADFLRQTIGFSAQRLMELGVESAVGAADSEGCCDRLAQRNGQRASRIVRIDRRLLNRGRGDSPFMLAPCSPDLDPVEQVLAKLMSTLRQMAKLSRRRPPGRRRHRPLPSQRMPRLFAKRPMPVSLNGICASDNFPVHELRVAY
ncbi:MAG: hypothetical protein ABR878_06405 [Roseiarcus sp.]